MADGSLAEAVEALHERLESVKARIRASPPSPGKVFERGEAEPTGEDAGANGRGSSTGDGSAGEGHATTDTARAGSDAGTDPEGKPEDAEVRRCDRCRRILGDDPFETDDGLYCHHCEQRILEERGEATRAESRHGARGGSPSSAGIEAGNSGGPGPMTEWKGRDLSALQRGIMKALQEAYPGYQTAMEIADRLSGGAELIGTTDKSAVNSELYGTLSEWLEREGETPPHWSLRPGEPSKEDSGVESDRPSDASRGDASPGDDADGYRLPGGGILSRQDQVGSVPDTDDPESNGESSYELCSICVTEHPEEHVRAFREQMICRSCWEELGIGKSRERPGDGSGGGN